MAKRSLGSEAPNNPSTMTSEELVLCVRSNRELIADDLVAVIDSQKQIQSLNSFAIRNEFTHEEMVEKKFIQFVNRRQAVRIYKNPTIEVEVGKL